MWSFQYAVFILMCMNVVRFTWSVFDYPNVVALKVKLSVMFELESF